VPLHKFKGLLDQEQRQESKLLNMFYLNTKPFLLNKQLIGGAIRIKRDEHHKVNRSHHKKTNIIERGVITKKRRT
jgi:hypothetical protein